MYFFTQEKVGKNDIFNEMTEGLECSSLWNYISYDMKISFGNVSEFKIYKVFNHPNFQYFLKIKLELLGFYMEKQFCGSGYSKVYKFHYME